MTTYSNRINRDQHLTVLWRTLDRAWLTARMAARQLLLTLLLTQLTGWNDGAGQLNFVTTIMDRFHDHYPKEEK